MLFLALLISTNVSLACSWWPEGEYVRFSLFSSHLAEGDDASPLFYSAHLFNEYAVDEYNGPQENLNEWYAYFDGKFEIKDIDQVIYKYTYNYDRWYRPEQPEVDMSKNPLLIHFQEGNDEDVAEYLTFAVDLEDKLRVDPWDKKKEMDVEGVIQSMGFAKSKLKSVDDETLKLRYAYQMIVVGYYLLEYDVVDKYYKKYFENCEQETVIKSWAQFYWAGMQADRDVKLYNWSRVFDESKSKCKYIFQRFPDKRSEVSGVLKMCKNDREKAAVLSILAFKNPGRAMDQIKEIAHLNANDELLDILLIREINKMEDWYLTNYYTGYGMSLDSWWDDDGLFEFVKEKNFQSDKAYLKEFLELTKNIVKNRGVENKGLWYTSIAYMAYMLDDKTETDKYIKLAHKNADSKEIKGQLLVIDLLSLVKHENDWDVKFQSSIMKKEKEIRNYENEIYRYDRFHSQLMLAISRKYLAEGDLTLAALFETKVKQGDVYERYGGWYSPGTSGYQAFDLLNENATAEDMDAFFNFWNKKNKTPLEQWLCEDLEKYKWRLTDLWGTAYFREDKLDEALAIYETIPDSVWHVDNWELHYYYDQELKNDPFESNLYGRGYGPNWGKTYTKPEFVKEILRLKSKLDKKDKDASYTALLLGNAYYNMTANGNSYYYTEYGWSSWIKDDYPRDQSYYYNSERALKYYELAEELAPNKKYAAYCHRMKLKCLRDGYYGLETWKDKYEQDWKNFMAKYPNHAPKLKNCDHLMYYTDAWKNG